MKSIILLGIAMLSAAQLSSAAACSSGTLSSYLALGSGGCTIGSDTLSGFQSLSGISGAMAISPLAVSISPTGGSFDPGLTFSTPQTAASNVLLESIFTYQISGNSFVGSSISLGGSSETVDGAVTEIQNFCAAGTFDADGVSNCTGTPGSLLTLDGIQQTDQSSFSPALFLNVTNDFTLDGGTAGSAAGGTFTNSFTATPEPASLLLAGLGLTMAGCARIRFARASSSKDKP